MSMWNPFPMQPAKAMALTKLARRMPAVKPRIFGATKKPKHLCISHSAQRICSNLPPRILMQSRTISGAWRYTPTTAAGLESYRNTSLVCLMASRSLFRLVAQGHLAPSTSSTRQRMAQSQHSFCSGNSSIGGCYECQGVLRVLLVSPSLSCKHHVGEGVYVDKQCIEPL